MAKKKSKRKRQFTIPIAVVAGATAGVFIPPPGRQWSPLTAAMKGDFNRAMSSLLMNYTGYNTDNNQWNIMNARGLLLAIVGGVSHKVASVLGINRALGQARVPFLRI